MKNLSKILLFSLVSNFTCLSAEEDMKTWFGDPDLQGVWTNASLTTLAVSYTHLTLPTSDLV